MRHVLLPSRSGPLHPTMPAAAVSASAIPYELLGFVMRQLLCRQVDETVRALLRTTSTGVSTPLARPRVDWIAVATTTVDSGRAAYQPPPVAPPCLSALGDSPQSDMHLSYVRPQFALQSSGT